MGAVEEKIKPGGGLVAGAQSLLEEMKLLKEMQDHSGQLLYSNFSAKAKAILKRVSFIGGSLRFVLILFFCFFPTLNFLPQQSENQ